jgi:hypothetical protein
MRAGFPNSFFSSCVFFNQLLTVSSFCPVFCFVLLVLEAFSAPASGGGGCPAFWLFVLALEAFSAPASGRFETVSSLYESTAL